MHFYLQKSSSLVKISKSFYVHFYDHEIAEPADFLKCNQFNYSRRYFFKSYFKKCYI